MFPVNQSILKQQKLLVLKAIEYEKSLHQDKKEKINKNWIQKMSAEGEILLDDNMKEENELHHSKKDKNVRLRKEQQMSHIREDFKFLASRQIVQMGQSSFLTPELAERLNELAKVNKKRNRENKIDIGKHFQSRKKKKK